MKLTSKLLKKLIKEEMEMVPTYDQSPSAAKSPQQLIWDVLRAAQDSGEDGLTDGEWKKLLKRVYGDRSRREMYAITKQLDGTIADYDADRVPPKWLPVGESPMNEQSNAAGITSEQISEMIEEETDSVMQEAQGTIKPSQEHIALAKSPEFQKSFQAALKNPKFKAAWEKSLGGDQQQEAKTKYGGIGFDNKYHPKKTGIDPRSKEAGELYGTSAEDSEPMGAMGVGFGGGIAVMTLMGNLAPAFMATTAGAAAAMSLPVAGALAGMWFLAKKDKARKTQEE